MSAGDSVSVQNCAKYVDCLLVFWPGVRLENRLDHVSLHFRSMISFGAFSISDQVMAVPEQEPVLAPNDKKRRRIGFFFMSGAREREKPQ